MGAALCWSLGGLLIKSVAWPPVAVAGGRGLIAALFLLATTRPLRFTFSRAQWAGAVAYSACTVLFCVATKLTTAANAILLQYTAPVWVALAGARLLGERPRRADWATIAVVLAGLALFFSDSLAFGHLRGDLLAVASGVAFAAMTIALRRQKAGSPAESIILGNFLSFAVGAWWIFHAPALAPAGWLALGLLGVVQLGFSYWLYARAITAVSALEAVLLPVIEPILNPVWVLLALGERPNGRALAGGGLVLAAVIARAVAALRDGRAPAAPAPAPGWRPAGAAGRRGRD